MQTCIVHQIRASMRYVTYNDRKRVAADLKPVYPPSTPRPRRHALEAFDEQLGRALPDDRRVLARALGAHHPVPRAARRPAPAVYTTNSIENLNRQIRKTIKTRGHFPDEQAATKLIYLAIQRAETKWKTAYNWTAALRALKIHFGDRLPD